MSARDITIREACVTSARCPSYPFCAPTWTAPPASHAAFCAEDWTAGAVWPGQMDDKLEEGTDHWSFLPVERPTIPKGTDHPVDAFLNSRLNNEKIPPNPSTDSLSLVEHTYSVPE